jgi:3-hydroxyacyl-CoA dehydrogenase
MRDWGWPMGPLRLIDEVGVDVTGAIFGEMEHYFPGRFTASKLCRQMLAEGLKGRKNGANAGFYDYAENRAVLNPAMAKLAAGSAPPQRVWEAGTIQDHLNGVLIDEAGHALAEGVVKTPDEADLALLLGAGFPAFRGGLLRFAGGIGRSIG